MKERDSAVARTIKSPFQPCHPLSTLVRLWLSSSSMSEGFKSSSMSQTGLGLRTRFLVACGSPAVGGDSLRSSSMSHGGLGSLDVGAVASERPSKLLLRAGSSGDSTGRSLPFPFRWATSVSWLNRVCEKDNALVALLRKGFSKASLIRLTLIWPNPGSWSSWSEVARAMSAKLYRRVNRELPQIFVDALPQKFAASQHRSY